MVVAIFVTTIMAELASLNIFNTRLRESVLGGVPIELGLMTPGFINSFPASGQKGINMHRGS